MEFEQGENDPINKKEAVVIYFQFFETCYSYFGRLFMVDKPTQSHKRNPISEEY